MKWLLTGIAILFFSTSLYGQEKFQSWCWQGGQPVVTQGLNSTTRVMRSFPTCTITVFLAGSTTSATIYSNVNKTPLANPFTNQNATTGQYFFFADPAFHYDIQVAAPGLATYTMTYVNIGGSSEGGGGARLACPIAGTLDQTISGVYGQLNGMPGIIDCGSLQGDQVFMTDPFAMMTVPITVILPASRMSTAVNLAIPTNVFLQFNQGSVLVPAAGVTVTISGPIQAPQSQIFDGAGAVTFGILSDVAGDFFGRHGTTVSYNNRILPQWFGALGNSTTGTDGNDDTQALNNAIQAAAAGNHGVFLPAGNYRITGSLNLTRLWGNFTLEGEGPYRSNIYCEENGNPCLDMTGSGFLKLSNFGVRTSGGDVPSELILVARLLNGNSAGNHLFDHINLEGHASHAVLLFYGSEQNLVSNSSISSGGGAAGSNDGPAFVGAMGNTTPPGGNNQAAGWTASSPFVQIGTGEGGTSSNTFVNDQFLSATPVMTRSLIYLWGMHETAFYGCFSASNSPATVDARMIPYPSGPTAGWYKTTATFDTWADESQAPPPNKQSVLFSDPGNAAEPSIRGFHIKNSWTFQIYGQDNVWIDDLDYQGGHYSASVPVPTGAKLSVWRMDNSSVLPSLHEANLTYAIRSAGTGNVFGSIPHANIQIVPGVIVSTDDVQVTGIACTTAAAAGATCTVTFQNNFGQTNQETFCRFRNTPTPNTGIPMVLNVATVDANSFTVTIGTYNGQAAGGGTIVCSSNFSF